MSSKLDYNRQLFQVQSVNDLESLLSSLNDSDNKIEEKLSSFISTQTPKNSLKVHSLDLSKTSISTLVSESRDLIDQLNISSNSAARITLKVRTLDNESMRVQQTLEYVEKVIELKQNMVLVSSALDEQNWPLASLKINDIRSIKKEILEGTFTEKTVPSSELPELPKITLNNWIKDLTALFKREFNKAADTKNMEVLTKYFSLFPLLGEEKVGISLYANFICSVISQQSRFLIKNDLSSATLAMNNPSLYAMIITKLFENIASIITQHSRIIIKHYGQLNMLEIITKIQNECDSQAGIIIDTFWDNRKVERLIHEIKEYSSDARNSSSFARPRSGTPDVNNSEHEDDDVNVVSVGELLAELSAILNRWMLYCKFIQIHWNEYSLSPEELNIDEKKSKIIVPPPLASSRFNTKIYNNLLPCYIELSTFFFRRSIEKAFEIEEVPTITDLNSPELSNSLSSSIVDDVMYLLNIVLRESIETGFLRIIITSIINITNTLTTNYLEITAEKLHDEINKIKLNVNWSKLFRNGNYNGITANLGSFQQGVPQFAEIMKSFTSTNNNALSSSINNNSMSNTNNNPIVNLPANKNLINYLILLNNLELSNGYCVKIVNDIKQIVPQNVPYNSDLMGNFPSSSSSSSSLSNNDISSIHKSIEKKLDMLIKHFTTNSNTIITHHLRILFEQILKQKLTVLIDDCFKTADFMVVPNSSEAASNSYLDSLDDQNELVIKFSISFGMLMESFQKLLTPENLLKLINDYVSKYLANLLELKIWNLDGKINELGAIKLDRDISNIISIVCTNAKSSLGISTSSEIGINIGNVAAGYYKMRDNFTRVTQIVMLLGMDEEEEEEGISWIISDDDKRKGRELRVERKN